MSLAFLGLTSEIIGVAFVAFLVGGFIKGVFGFGLPVITMGILPIALPVEQAIVVSALIQPVTNMGQLLSSGAVLSAVQVSWPLIISLPIGVFVGALFIVRADSEMLLLFIGMMIIVFALSNLTLYRLRIDESQRTAAGVFLGAFAGFMGALTSINGPILIAYLLGIGADRRLFRSSIALLFIASSLFIVIGLGSVGLLTAPLFALALFSILPSFVGMWLGDRLGKRIPAERFRKWVLIVLVVLGLRFIWSGLA